MGMLAGGGGQNLQTIGCTSSHRLGVTAQAIPTVWGVHEEQLVTATSNNR